MSFQLSNLFAVDCGNNCIHKWLFSSATSRVDGSDPLLWGHAGRGPGEFINPVGLDVDESLDRVYVTDPVNNRIQAFDSGGNFIFEFTRYWDRTVQPNQVRSISHSVGIGSDDAGKLFLGVDADLASFHPGGN